MKIAQYIQENKYTELSDVAYGVVMLIGRKKLPKIEDGERNGDGSTKILQNGNCFAQSIVMIDNFAVTVEVEMTPKFKIVKKYVSPVREF